MARIVSSAAIAVCLAAAAIAQIPFDYATTTRLTGSLAVADPCHAIAARGDLACLATAADLVCVDVADPEAPAILGTVAHGLDPESVVWLADPYVALVSADGVVAVFDVATPSAPRPVTALSPVGATYAATLAGDVLVLAGAGGLRFVDVSDPGQPAHAGTAFAGSAFFDVAVLPGGHVIVTQEDAVREIDLGDLSAPVVVETFTPRYYPWPVWYAEVVPAGDRVFVTAYQDQPVAGGAATRQPPVPATTVMLMDPAVPGDESLVAYWQGSWDDGVRLHGAGGGLVYGSVDDQLVIFAADAQPPNVHALEPALVLATKVPVAGVAVGGAAAGVALAADEVATLPAGEARGIPPASRFARGQYGEFVSPRWAWSRTPADFYFHPSYTVYLWDLVDPLQPAVRESVHCSMGFEFFLNAQAVAARDELVVWRVRGPGATILSLRDFGADPPVSAALEPARDEVVFVDDLLLGHGYGEFATRAIDVFDISDPHAPALQASLEVPDLSGLWALEPAGALVFRSGTAGRRFQRLDLHDPTQPQLVGEATTTDNPTCVVPWGDLVLVGDWAGTLRVLEPATMSWRGTLTAPEGGYVVDVVVAESRIWACWSDAGVVLLDLADPDAPALASDFAPLPGAPEDLGPSASPGAVYAACGRPGVQLVVRGADGEPRLVGGGGVHARDVGQTDGWVRTFGAVLPPAALDVTAAPVNAAPAAGVLRAAPNPFNPQTVVRYTMPAAGAVDLAVYDLRGRLVRTLRRGAATAGEHRVRWDGRDDGGRAAPTGVYLVRLRTAHGAATTRVCLVR